MLLSFADLQAIFDSPILLEANALLKREQVAVPDVRRGGQLITSIIRISEEPPIRTYIRVEAKADASVSIQGECSCCGKRNCEHIAAVLLQVLLDEQGRAGEIANLQPPKPTSNRTPSLDYPAHIQQRLLYLLFPVVDDGNGIDVCTRSAKLVKGGSFSNLRKYKPSWASDGTPPRYLLDIDRHLLAELDKLPLKPSQQRRQLQGESGTRILQSILETGRSFLGQLEIRLQPGQTRTGSLQWRLDPQGNQYPEFQVEPKAQWVFPMATAHYLDPATGECGKLTTGMPVPLTDELLRLPPMDPLQVDRYYQGLMARYPAVEITAPHHLKLEQLAECQPTPHLLLTTFPSAEPEAQPDDRVELCFDYDGLRLSRDQPSQLLRGDRVFQVTRQERFEAACAKQLSAAGLSKIKHKNRDDFFTVRSDPEVWFSLQQQLLPRLLAQGWQVRIDDNFRYRLAEVQEWFSTLNPVENSSSYRFSFGVLVDERQINLLPELVSLLHEYSWNQLRELSPQHCFYLPLGDGQKVAAPMARIRPILDNLFELFQPDALDKEGHLPLSKIQLTRLNGLADKDDVTESCWYDRCEVRALAERLRQIEHPPEVSPPNGLQAKLRDYQQQGLAWLQFLRDNELAGVLADDMGLGKTIQTLAHILLEREQGRLDRPCLVIAPTSLMVNWRQEARRFTPDLKVLVLHGQDRQQRFADIPYNDLIITTYPLLLRDHERLFRYHYHLLILDEAQMIKNPQAKGSQLVREIPARHRLCLTGTPMENHLGELWSLFDFLLPGLLGRQSQFKKMIRNPIEQFGDEETGQRLAGWLRPFMLRRTKQEVVTELPPKSVMIRGVELEGEQRALYERIRLDLREQIKSAVAEKGIGQCRILILNALLKMRQVCCDPRLLAAEGAAGVTESAKLEMLMEMLPEMIEEGRRVLLFSQFTSMLALIETALKKTDIEYVTLTGKTRDRASQIERFQRGEVPLFLISLKAGGVGLNLTAADSVIHYDPWWNPAVERQATDRAHRIGQSNPVFVYKLITTGTVEERIQEMQERKQQLADNLFEQSGTSGEWWSEADLDAMFEPLG